MKIIRNPTTADGTVTYNFDVAGYRFLIKNFTDGDIYAALKTGATKAESALIPSGCAQILVANDFDKYAERTDTVQVIADTASDKGVEVQCIRY